MVADVIDALKDGVKIHDSLFWKPAPKLEGLVQDPGTYAWYIRVRGVAAALLPNVAGPGQVVFEENGEAAYRIEAATAAQIEEIRAKVAVLGGEVALVLKQLAD